MAAVISGAEAWSAEGSEVGVLVVHGFTGNPVSMRPLAEHLAAAGYAVEMPRLPGHGTRWQDLQRTTWRDWAREAVAAFENLRSRTRARVVVGLSMGGTMALHLATTRAADIAGTAVINPSLRTRDPRLKALPVLKHLVPALAGIGNDIAKPGADEQCYNRLPLKALASFLEFENVVRARVTEITTPLLVLTAPQDHTVSPENSTELLAAVASTDKAQVLLERSYHVATLDYDAELLQERITEFVARVTET